MIGSTLSFILPFLSSWQACVCSTYRANNLVNHVMKTWPSTIKVQKKKERTQWREFACCSRFLSQKFEVFLSSCWNVWVYSETKDHPMCRLLSQSCSTYELNIQVFWSYVYLRQLLNIFQSNTSIFSSGWFIQ